MFHGSRRLQLYLCSQLTTSTTRLAYYSTTAVAPAAAMSRTPTTTPTDDKTNTEEAGAAATTTNTPNRVLLQYNEDCAVATTAGAVPSTAPEWAVAASERLLLRNRRAQAQGETAAAAAASVQPPKGVTRVLLHSCCAPCSGAMVEEMISNRIVEHVTVFFYNPNIHPRQEYMIRKEENKRYCAKLGIDFVDCDYGDVDAWYERVKGMEYDPERGRRCTECFDMRMERTALYAHEHNFHCILTTNATSRWKDRDQVDESGFRAAARYENLQYWAHNWQSDSMTVRKYHISAIERFYKQEYCGCSYSLRDSNAWRKANGIPKIQIGGDTAGLGDRYYSDPNVDAQEESQVRMQHVIQ
jgi:epoxyqueuosine reductase